MMWLEKVTKAGQIKLDDWIIIDDGAQARAVRVKCVLHPGISNYGDGGEEILISKKKNIYFITAMYLDEISWAKEVCIIRHGSE